MALMKTKRKGVNPGEDPTKKKDEKVKLEGATTSNIFYADIKDEAERNKTAIKYENANYDKAMKSGNMVSLSSIKTSNPKAYTILSNSVQSKKDTYGEIEDYIVDKKYANVSSYEELGYPKGYSPEDRQKAIKAGKLEDYEKKMGGKTQFTAGPDFGYYTKYASEKKVKAEDLSTSKLPLLKASLPTKGGALKERVTASKPEDWSIKKPSKFHGTSISTTAPSLNRRKAVKGVDDVKFGAGANVVKDGTNRGYFGVKKLAYAAVANPLNKVRFNKEVRQGKAYFGSHEGESSSDLADNKTKLRADKAGLKQAVKEVRKGTAEPTSLSKSDRIKGYRAEIGNVNKELKTNRQAGRYLKDLRLGGSFQAGATVNENTSTGTRSGKIQFATPKSFKGYVGSPQNKRTDKLINLNIHPVNRNTIEAQLKTSDKKQNRLKR